jgi:prepilin-type N-terminal cleavage/methylation domain-containing protein
MRSHRTMDRAERGFTLIELMVSLLVLSLVVTATMVIGSTLMAGYRHQRRMVLAERAARGSIDVLADAVRNASAGVPSGNLEDAANCATYHGLRVTNHSDAPDELELIYASGGVVSSLRQTFVATSTELRIADATGLRVGDRVLVTDFDRGHLVEIEGIADAGSEWSLRIGAPLTRCPGVTFPSSGYPSGSLVVRAASARFFIDTSEATGGVPTLMIDPDGPGPFEAEPIAEGVEDLQIAVGVDVDEDGSVLEDGSNTDEWFYNVAGDGDPPDVVTRPPRALRLTVVARTVREESSQLIGERPAAEDRPSAAGRDPYLRRVLSTTVEIRNLEGSP